MEPMTAEQWLRQEISRQPLLAAEIEILPGCRTSADGRRSGRPCLARSSTPTRSATGAPALLDLPPACRPCLPVIQAALLLEFSDEQILDLGRKGIDLRDLSEVEVSWLEDVKVKAVQSWRRDGSGPPYRLENRESRGVRRRGEDSSGAFLRPEVRRDSARTPLRAGDFKSASGRYSPDPARRKLSGDNDFGRPPVCP